MVRVSVVSERPRQKNLTQVEVQGNGGRNAFFYCGNEIEAPLERVPLERHNRQPDARSQKILFARRATAPNANLGPLELGTPLLTLLSSVCCNRTDIERDHECRHHLHNSDRALFGNRPAVEL